MITKDDLERRIAKESSKQGAFRPTVRYDADGDYLEFVVSTESFYVDDHKPAGIYYGQDTAEVVGFRIKKVSQLIGDFIKKNPGFKSEFHNRRIKMEQIITVKIWSSDPNADDMVLIAFKKLREVAKKNDIEAEIDDLGHLVG